MRGYANREQAGEVLAQLLEPYRAVRDHVIVLALPRGGVLVAAPVAASLGCPLDVLVVRKIGVPRREELAMGAIGPGGVQVLDTALIDRIGVADKAVAEIVAREHDELERRELVYRGGRPPLDLAGKVALLVDDGLATGATMWAAVLAAQEMGAASTVVVVPVGARSTCDELRELADGVVCALVPDSFVAVGNWYDDFHAVTDDEVLTTLAEAEAWPMTKLKPRPGQKP